MMSRNLDPGSGLVHLPHVPLALCFNQSVLRPKTFLSNERLPCDFIVFSHRYSTIIVCQEDYDSSLHIAEVGSG